MAANDVTLPFGWKWSTLSDSCEIIVGQSPPSATYNTERNGLPFFQGKAEFGKIYPTPIKWCSKPNKIARSGDILISVRAPVGPTNLCFEESCIGRGLAAIRPKDMMPNRYVFYYLRYIEEEWSKKATGTTFKAITGDVLRRQEIPLAPITEQERIVARIESLFTQLDAGVAGLKRVQAALKRYRASVLRAACWGRLVPQDPNDEPVEKLLKRILASRGDRTNKNQQTIDGLPDGWAWAIIEQLAYVGTGATPLRSKASYYDQGTIPWVTSGALNNLFIDESDKFITELALKETNAKVFPVGSLLVALYGEGKTRGKVSELRISAATNQACAGLVFNGLAFDFKSYVKLFLQKNYQDIRRLSSGGVQPNLNLSLIKNTLLPLPPLAEQRRIVAEVERRLSVVQELEQTVSASLKRAARLCQAILKQAFEGRLV